MELCEELFYNDSRVIAALASMIEGVEGEDIRWKAGFYNVHTLLADFGLDMRERCEFTESLYKAYYQEFNTAPGESQVTLSRLLNDKYRGAFPVFSQLLEKTPVDDESSLIANLFRDRSEANKGIVSELKATIRSGKGSIKATLELLSSLIHMSINRQFITRQRAHELVLYHHLNKYYSSLAIRAKQTTPENRSYEGKVQILPAT
jgi:thiopeptide-type bacteriocin biosynthesis protein